MGFDDGPDSLALGLFQALRGEAEACGDLPLAANPLLELVVGFHSSRLSMSPVAVQQTGRLMACIWSNAPRTPSTHHLPTAAVGGSGCDSSSSRLRRRLLPGVT